MRNRLIAAAALGALTMAGGCGASDEHTFISPLEKPATVYVIDASSQQPLWVKPIPAGQKLTVNFKRTAAADFTTQPIPADLLQWKLYPGSTVAVLGLEPKKPYERGQFDLPGTPIRMAVLYAEADEHPTRRIDPGSVPSETKVQPPEIDRPLSEPDVQWPPSEEVGAETETEPPTGEAAVPETEADEEPAPEGDAAAEEPMPVPEADADADQDQQQDDAAATEELEAAVEPVEEESAEGEQPADEQPEQGSEDTMFK